MRSLRTTIAYDGTKFAGWQRQVAQRTVQGEFEKALEKITGAYVHTTASGRTDAGVHALGQVVGFRTPFEIANDVFARALNAELPEDIHVFDVSPAPDDFDPIRDAFRKRYRYVVQDTRVPDLFNRQYSWKLWQTLDVPAMQEASRCLIGKHDFQSFETGGSSRLTTIRTVTDILVERRRGEFIERVEIEVEADGFLYNMVRNIVGTLVQVGRYRRPIDWVPQVLAHRDRRTAGMTAHAQGLFLMWVKYEV